MGLATWMRALDTLTGLADVARRFRGVAPDEAMSPSSAGSPGQLEARLAGVVVAALKEAFDRDRTRLDLERAQIDADRERAEEAMRLELRRQAVDRGLSQLRAQAVMSLVVWLTSAVLSVSLPQVGEWLPKMLLAAGWFALIAAIACAFLAQRGLSGWAVSSDRDGSPPPLLAARAAPWLLVAGSLLTAGSLIAAL